MESSQQILCFVCNQMLPATQIQNHVFKCKLGYETKKKAKLQTPEEYNLLFTTIKGGLVLGEEELENFNAIIASKSVASGGVSMSKSTNFSQTSQYSSGGMGGLGQSQSFGNTMPQQRGVPARQKGERPRLLMCPLCGREFGSMSLPIHMKTCRQKFELEQQQLPRNQRKNADKIINNYNKNNAMLQSNGNYNWDEINNQAFEQFKNEALVPCENCGRTFLPDRWTVHLRSCKTKKI